MEAVLVLTAGAFGAGVGGIVGGGVGKIIQEVAQCCVEEPCAAVGSETDDCTVGGAILGTLGSSFAEAYMIHLNKSNN